MLRRTLCLVTAVALTTMMVDDCWGRGPRGGGRRGGGARSAPSVKRSPTIGSGPALRHSSPTGTLGNIGSRPGAHSSVADALRQQIGSGPLSRDQLNRFLDAPAGPDELGSRLSESDWRSQTDKLRSDWQQNHDELSSQRQQRADDIRSQAEQFYNQNAATSSHYNGDSPSDWWNYMWAENPAYAWWSITSPVRWATWGAVAGWVGGGGSYYSDAAYYDYGYATTGEEIVYANGEPVAKTDELADSAQALAQTGADALATATADGSASEIEWLPLGVYALTPTDESEPVMFVQLAVAKDGTLAGTYHNVLSGETAAVHGAVDSATQRAAFAIGDGSPATVETGIGNLTEDHTPVLVHYAGGETKTWFITRLPEPETASAVSTDQPTGTVRAPNPS